MEKGKKAADTTTTLQVRLTADMDRMLSMFVQTKLLRATNMDFKGDDKVREMLRLSQKHKYSKSAIARSFLKKALDSWLLEEVEVEDN